MREEVLEVGELVGLEGSVLVGSLVDILVEGHSSLVWVRGGVLMMALREPMPVTGVGLGGSLLGLENRLFFIVNILLFYGDILSKPETSRQNKRPKAIHKESVVNK